MIGAITMCHFNRPAYTKQVLEALSKCDGVEDWLILPHVEPGNEEVRALIEAIDFAECRPTFNWMRLGVDANTELALVDGFARADFVVHIEDDIVCAPDALTYYAWAKRTFRADPSVFSVTGYNQRDTPPDASELHAARRRRWFHPWGWATWSDRWERVRGRLAFAKAGWDRVVLDMGGHEIYPELSRSQNIGMKSSVQGYSEAWYRANHHLGVWAGALDVPAAPFHEAPAVWWVPRGEIRVDE